MCPGIALASLVDHLAMAATRATRASIALA
jgi:hypothetical protein